MSEDLCRLCLVKCNSMGLMIFSEEGRSRKIHECLSLIITDDDRLPLIICPNCDNKLEFFYQFKEETIKNQHYLNDLIKALPIPEYHQYGHMQSGIDQNFFKDDFITSNPSDNSILNSIENNMHSIDDNIYANVTNLYGTSHETQTANDFDQCHYGNVPSYTPTEEIMNDPSVYKNIEEFHMVLDSTADNTNLVTNNDLIGAVYDTMDVNVNVNVNPGTEIVDEKITAMTETEPPISAIIREAIDDEISSPSIMSNVGSDEPFGYDDFDENLESAPQSVDHNNVNNLLDEKIEEFRNKKNKTSPKICTICNKLYRTNYKLKLHMMTHSNAHKHKCNFEGCDKSFKSKLGLQEHEARHTGKFNFYCEVCNKGFHVRSYLIGHQRIHSNAKKFKCSTCNISFKSKQSLIDHENRHLGIKMFTCKDKSCNKGFITKALLESHLKTHEKIENDEKKFACDICNKRFVSKSYLKVHKKIHSNEKNFVCFCGKMFLQKSDLELHSRTHTGEREFVCEFCGKSFARRDTFAIHKRSHTKEKPYECIYCKKTFSQITPLINHKRRIHGIDQTKEKVIEPSIFIPPIEGLTDENIQDSIVYISQLEALPEETEPQASDFLENLTETTTIST